MHLNTKTFNGTNNPFSKTIKTIQYLWYVWSHICDKQDNKNTNDMLRINVGTNQSLHKL